MAHKVTADQFWSFPYTVKQTPHGKLALYYALGCEYDDRPVIIEDMALATGLDRGECADWVEQFVDDGILEKSVVTS